MSLQPCDSNQDKVSRMMCFRTFKRSLTASSSSSSSTRRGHQRRRRKMSSSRRSNSSLSISSGSDFGEEIIHQLEQPQENSLQESNVTNQRDREPQSSPRIPATSNKQPQQNRKPSDAKTNDKSPENSQDKDDDVSLKLVKDTETGRNMFLGSNGYVRHQVPWKIPVNKVNPEVIAALNENTSIGRQSRLGSRNSETKIQVEVTSSSSSPPEAVSQSKKQTDSSPNGILPSNGVFRSLLMAKESRRHRRRRSTIFSITDDKGETMSIDSVESVVDAVGRSRLDIETDDSDDDLEKDVALQVMRSKSRSKNHPDK